MLARSKSSHYIDKKFTLNLKIKALLLTPWCVRLGYRWWRKKCIWSYNLAESTSVSVAVLYRAKRGIQKMVVRSRLSCLVFSWHSSSNVKLRLWFFSVRFTLYLCSVWSINLWAIENFIFGMRSIERKMRPINRRCIHVYNMFNIKTSFVSAHKACTYLVRKSSLNSIW